jgi:hypothetical protein
MSFTLSEIFSTSLFKVYGIGEEDIFRMSNEDPKIRPDTNSLPNWITHALLLDEVKNKKVRKQKKIIIIHIAHLPNIICLRDIENLLQTCYDQKITVVIEAAWEAAECIPNCDPNIKNLNDSLNLIKDIICPEYFKILVSTDLDYIYVDEEYKSLLIYVNMFAIMVNLYKENKQLISLESKEKKYNFSCLGGRVIRDHRMFFLTEIFYRNMKDDKFLVTAIPPLQQWERVKQPSKDCPELKLKNKVLEKYKNIKEITNKHLHKIFKENLLDIFLPISRPGWQKTQNYLIDNFDKIVLNHKFVDENTQETTIDELNMSKRTVPYDHIIPTGLLESHINIPLETYPNDCFYTEKTFKPIIAGIPFISMCTPNFTKSFKKMGFEPYYDIFDYSYENELQMYARINLIVDQIQLLSMEKNLKELVEDSKEVIRHNQNQMKNISDDISFLGRI